MDLVFYMATEYQLARQENHYSDDGDAGVQGDTEYTL
jgi:hypothetical protein